VIAFFAVETIVSRLLHFADAQPDAVAFVEKGQRLTYGGLGRRARATAGWLHGAGVRAGDTVGVSFDGLGTDSIRSLQFFYALSFLGAIILGNGINYPIVLVSRYLEFRARGQTPAEARRDAVWNAFRFSFSSIRRRIGSISIGRILCHASATLSAVPARPSGIPVTHF